MNDYKVTLKNGRYVVEAIDGDKYTCSASCVDSIAKQTGKSSESESVAVVVALVQSKGNTFGGVQNSHARFRNELLEEKLSAIIEAYGLEDTLEYILEMKYCELEKILKSDNTLAEMDDYVMNNF